MTTTSATVSTPSLDVLDRILATAGLTHSIAVERMAGGSNAVFRVDLSDGGCFNLKTYDQLRNKAPRREAHAARLVADAGVPATRYLLVDETCEALPYRFALTSHLAGQTLEQLRAQGQVDLTDAYGQMGTLLRQVHAVRMPAYGDIDDDGTAGPHTTNAAFVAASAHKSLEHFRERGGPPDLAHAIRRAVDDNLDVADVSAGAVFAHNDFHPGNVLAQTGPGGATITGVIDFGNVRAADALWDLAKAIFCTEHMAPGAGALLRESYGPLHHPDPDRALWLYIMLHRVSMWSWLRWIGVIADDQPHPLIDDLEAMLAERRGPRFR
jgi:Ser/Thr protein kinase RdoA (MazF antagonist)